MSKKLEVYRDKKTGQYVIERINEFNHSHRSYYENLDELYDGIDSHKEFADEKDYEFVIRDSDLYAKAIKYMGFNIREKEPMMGRPPMGVTKKVSLTLTEDKWKWFDEQANGNRSAFLREIVDDTYWREADWSNQACFGYVIKSAKTLGYTDTQITELIREMQYSMDMKTVDEAKKIYIESDY